MTNSNFLKNLEAIERGELPDEVLQTMLAAALKTHSEELTGEAVFHSFFYILMTFAKDHPEDHKALKPCITPLVKYLHELEQARQVEGRH